MILYLDIAYETAYTAGAAVGMFFVMAIVLVPWIFYLLTLQNTLKSIQPQHRAMPPGEVWLMFIPLFNLVWHFFVVSRVSDSIRRELQARGQPPAERPAYGIGLAVCILSCCFWIPVVNAFSALGCLVCWIIYWVKVNEYRKQFRQAPYSHSDSQIFDFDKY